MLILIDGYNLFKYGMKANKLSENQRLQALSYLKKYALSKQHTLKVFFDGGQSIYKEKTIVNVYLTICHVGYGKSADDAIVDYVHAHKQRPMLMISSDRDLQKLVSLHNVEVLKSEDFWEYITYKPTTSKPSTRSIGYKTSPDCNPAVDMLMSNVVIKAKVSDSDQDDKQAYSLSVKKVSKKERIIAQLLKKL